MTSLGQPAAAGSTRLPPHSSVRLKWKEARLVRSYERRLVCTKAVTEICIEGFPRSANSYAGRMFRFANPVAIAHHTHSVVNIELALAYGVPALVLMRHPIEAIASTSIFRDSAVAVEVGRWISFYEYVERVLGSIVLAEFGQVVTDFNSVISAINDKYRTSFRLIDDVGAAEAAAYRDLRKMSETMMLGPLKTPLPTGEREPEKGVRQVMASAHPRIGEACDLYNRVLQTCQEGSKAAETDAAFCG